MEDRIELTNREYKIYELVKGMKDGIGCYELFKIMNKTDAIHYDTFIELLFSLRIRDLIKIITEKNKITKRRTKMIHVIA